MLRQKKCTIVFGAFHHPVGGSLLQFHLHWLVKKNKAMPDEHAFAVLLNALGSECGVRIISQGMTPHMLGKLTKTIVKFFI